MSLMVRRDVQRILPGVVDRNAFFDTVVLSVWGKRRQRPGESVQLLDNPPIGGRGRNYARAWLGAFLPTGNPFEVRYGVMKNKRGFIPSLGLRVWSERAPVTIQDTIALIDALCPRGWRAKVSQVELTFDLTDRSMDYFWWRIQTRAQKVGYWEKEGQRTLYVGGRTSPSQLRIYEKTANVTRFEFTLKRRFLRQEWIHRLPDLQRLRTLDIGSLVRFREVRQDALTALEKTIQPEYRRRALRSFFDGYRWQDSLRAAKKLFKTGPETLSVASPDETLLREMQARLVC